MLPTGPLTVLAVCAAVMSNHTSGEVIVRLRHRLRTYDVDSTQKYKLSFTHPLSRALLLQTSQNPAQNSAPAPEPQAHTGHAFSRTFCRLFPETKVLTTT